MSVAAAFSLLPFIVSFPVYFKISDSFIHPNIIPFLASGGSSSSIQILNDADSGKHKRCRLAGDLSASGFVVDGLDLNKNYDLNMLITPNSLSSMLKPKIIRSIDDLSLNGLDILHFLSRIAFSFTLSLSFTIIQLVISEITEIMNVDTRKVIWDITLPLLITFLTYILPSLCIVDFITSKLTSWFSSLSTSRRFQSVVYLSALVIWVMCFNSIGNFLYSEYNFGSDPSSLDSLHSTFLFKFMFHSLQQLSVLGITLLSFLSGMGSISCLFFTYYKKEKRVNKRQIERLLMTLKTTDSLLALRVSEYQSGNTKSDLKDEINAINQMKNSIIDDIQYLLNKLLVSKFNATLSGKLTKMFNVGFSVYCIYKIFSTFFLKLPFILINEHYGTQQPPNTNDADALAITIAKIIVQFNDTYDVDALSMHVSLIISMSLFICSFTSVLTTIRSVTKVLPFQTKTPHTYPPNIASVTSKVQPVNNSLILLCAELTGIYILSQTLLMLSMLPYDLNQHIIQSFGNPLDNQFVTVWFDKMYSLSCLITLVLLIISDKLDKFYNDDEDFELDDHGFGFDEESMAESNKIA